MRRNRIVAALLFASFASLSAPAFAAATQNCKDSQGNLIPCGAPATPPAELPPVTVEGTRVSEVRADRFRDLINRWIYDAYNGSTGGRTQPVRDGAGLGVARPSGVLASDATPCTEASATGAPTTIGNPIVPATGNKLERETDFVSRGELPLYLTRTWHHQYSGPVTLFGTKWLTPFDASLRTAAGGELVAYRPDGARIRLAAHAPGEWRDARAGGRTRATSHGDGGYALWTSDNLVETYDAQGRIHTQRVPRGVGLTFRYEGPLLREVTHTNGRSIRFTWRDAVRGPQLEEVIDPAGNAWRYGYDASARLTSATGPASPSLTTTYHYAGASYWTLLGKSLNGVRYSTFAYDAKSRATLSEHAGGIDRNTFSYADGPDGLVSVLHINPLGKQTTYAYRHGKLLSATGHASPACAAGYREVTYDANGHVDLAADFAGRFTDFDHDAEGKLLRKVEAAGTPLARTTTYAWDAQGRAVRETLEGVLATEWTYRSDGLLASVTRTNLSAQGVPGQALVTEHRYTVHPNQIIATQIVDGPLQGTGDAMTRTFDTHGNLIREENGLGHATTYAVHDAFGRPARRSGPNGEVEHRTLDAAGRVIEVARWTGAHAFVSKQEWDGQGNLAAIVSPEGVRTSFAHDAVGRVVEITRPRPQAGDPFSFSTDFLSLTRNADGQVIETRTGHRAFGPWTVTAVTRTAYDELGRVLRALGADGRVMATHAYDDVGNRISTTDAHGHVTRFTYDALDRVVETVDAAGGRTTVAWDAADRVIRVSDARQNTTHYVLDGFGNLLEQASPDSGKTRWTYDAYGQRIGMTREDGAALSYQYDGMGRLLQAGIGGEWRQYQYDWCTGGVGRLCGVVVSTPDRMRNWTHFGYTPWGALVLKRESVFGSDDWTWYDREPDGRLQQIRYPSGVRVRHAYEQGALSGFFVDMGSGEVPVIQGITHRPFGAAEGWTHGNGLVRSHGFDLDGRMTAISVRDAATVRQSLTYHHDAANAITRITHGIDPGLTQDYGYDALHRLTTLNASGYAYDAVGNRIGHHDGGIPTTYAVDPDSNRLLGRSGHFNDTWTTNANGNVTAYSGADGVTHTAAYDAFNRLATHSRAGVHTSYEINALDERVGKWTAATGGRRFIRDGHRLLAEVDAAGKWTSYVWAGDELVGLVRNQQLHAVHNDHLGRPELVTNAAKTPVWRANNWAFKRFVALDMIGGLNIGFPGQYWDAESGLFHNGFRDLDQRTGRYLQVDPVGLEAGPNPFTYANQNPIHFVDPDGRFAFVLPLVPPVVAGVGKAIAFFGSAAAAGYGASEALDYFNEQAAAPSPAPPLPDDPAQCPGEGWEWKGAGEPGSNKGNWWNPETDGKLHPDFGHPPPKGPHWGYTDGDGNKWDHFPGRGWVPGNKR